MVHLRVIAPLPLAESAYCVVRDHPSALNIVRLREAAEQPDRDLILCDVAREDASLVVAELRSLGLERDGSIVLEPVSSLVSDAARRAEEAAVGFPVGIAAAPALAGALRALESAPDRLSPVSRPATLFISHPDEYTVLVALLAGAAGALSLSTAKSGALVGVLISVTTSQRPPTSALPPPTETGTRYAAPPVSSPST